MTPQEAPVEPAYGTSTPSHCTAKIKCDECLRGFYARVSERAIDLSVAYLKLRLASLPARPTNEDLYKVIYAAHWVQDLYSRQWREMTRQHELPSPPRALSGRQLLEEIGLCKPSSNYLPRLL